ncbi:MAG: metallophosphoesterase [Anaerovoracaceae bacterium]|nr:metallophosphoesterase [Anaerovoracaceae bacterium]
MSIYAIGDIHLSLTTDKPMEIFGGQWINHTNRIREKWERIVKETDTVIIPGDISWGLRRQEADEDLAWISRLPGQKVLIRGNHDLWWTSVTKLNQLDSRMYFLQNTHYMAEDYAICGSRGWICPGDPDFTAHDEKIYLRELQRFRFSLESAARAGAKKLIAALHYPPVRAGGESSGFTELAEEFGVEILVYGHLHGADAHTKAFKGIHRGVEYALVSGDFLTFCPKLIR